MQQRIHTKNRLTSIFMILLVVFSVLQVCAMPIRSALQTSLNNQNSIHHTVANDIGMAEMLSHDCCLADEQAEMSAACQDCHISEKVLKVSSPDSVKPSFALLYLVFQELLTVSHDVRFWQIFIEPDILVSLPAIYLKKVSFLE
ncbi:hypothetical protein EOPP23_00225 [Endozoicomonas sp. OPT23]|uniref:hypothetical protein n=1 Tax=Endozoicomonas sp. OPT23 TaxID=2072845 RepID=UPI00129B816E|nr:hypothetical protein [Endozoicomonas sp. OPT23]MRI31414.1 hypothetical protein [Endozoicomonas sp. OPT23]